MEHPQQLQKSRFLGSLNFSVALIEESWFPLSRKKLLLTKQANFSFVTSWSFLGAFSHTPGSGC